MYTSVDAKVFAVFDEVVVGTPGSVEVSDPADDPLPKSMQLDWLLLDPFMCRLA